MINPGFLVSFFNFLTYLINNKQKRLSADFDDVRISLVNLEQLKIKMPPHQYRPPSSGQSQCF